MHLIKDRNNHGDVHLRAKLEKNHLVRQGWAAVEMLADPHFRLRGHRPVANLVAVALEQTLKTFETNSKNAIRTVLAPRAIVSLRQAALGVSTIEDAVTLAADWRYYRIKITPSPIRRRGAASR